MELVPYAGKVIVAVEDRQPRKTAAGLLIKEPKHEGAPIAGTITAIGDGVTGLTIGSRVLFKEENPRGFKHEGKPYFALKPEQILAEVDKEAIIWG